MAQIRIFISHSHQDNLWCRPFSEALKAVGYDVWYDETGLQGGAAWIASIQHEVESRDVFLLILTPEAWESKWVQDELQLAIATRRRILPVLLRNTQVSGFLLTTQWITVVGEEAQAAARAAIKTIEAPPAPGRDATPHATTETLDDLKVLCRSLATEGRYTEALSACERALALDQNNIHVLKIKADVLQKIGEPRLEGRTRFQVLVINPEDESVWINRPQIFSSLDDEQELIQAYSLLHSSRRYGQLQLIQYGYERNDLLTTLLHALNRLNCLDVAMKLLVEVDDDSTRMYVCTQLREMARPDLATRLLEEWYSHAQYNNGSAGMPVCQMLCEMSQFELASHLLEVWYGFPPRLSKLADIPLLGMYGQALTEVGRREDGRSLRNLIVRIFENTYGLELRGRIVRRIFDGYYRTPWYSEEARAAFPVYLNALDGLGRAGYANRLRKAFGFR